MGNTEAVVTMSLSPAAAVERCARVLTEQRFKNVATGGGFVSAERRELGQWTKGQITLEITPDGQGSRVSIKAVAQPQSLVGLAFSPSGRMVKRLVRALPTA